MTITRARIAGPLAASIALAAATGCGSPDPATLVASPGPHADPPHVVQALVDGINARDEDLVRSLTSEGFGSYLVDVWFEGAHLTEATIGTSDAAGLAQPEESATVNVEFTPEGADASMQNGTAISWGFFLITDESGRWLVEDVGQG